MTICKGCGEPCRVVEVDFGIGPYEYWGATGFDSRPALVSNCCETDYEDGPAEPEPTITELDMLEDELGRVRGAAS